MAVLTNPVATNPGPAVDININVQGGLLAAWNNNAGTGLIGPNGQVVPIGAGAGAVALSAGTQSVGTGTVTFANSNGVSFGMSGSNQITASVKTNYAGTVFSTTTIGGSTAAGTLNTSGFTLALPAFVTAVGGASTEAIYVGGNSTGQSSQSTYTVGSLNLSAAGLVSVGWSSNSLILSAPATVSAPATSSLVGVGGISVSTNGSTISISAATSSLVGIQGISISTSGSTISAMNIPVSTYAPYWPASTSSLLLNVLGVSTAYPVFFPYQVDDVISFDMVAILQSYSYVTSSSAASLTQAVQFGLYSNNASTWSQISSGVSSLKMTNSGVSGTVSYATATSTSGYGYSTIGFSSTAAGESLIGSVGFRNPIMQFGGVMSLAPGWYALGLLSTASSSSANVGINQALIGNVLPMSNLFGLGQSTTVTNQMLGMGYGTATTVSLPASMAFSNMTNSLGIIPIITFAST